MQTISIVDEANNILNSFCNYGATGYDEKKLYIVKYIYKDTYEGNDQEDTWVLACENEEEVINIMKLNQKQFKRCGYEIISYTFKRIENTDNGYKVKIDRRVK